jgi:copper oxidase (laccase) domain-containing protein
VAANWIPANWAAPDCVVAGTTLRHGGVSGGSFKSLNLGALSGDDDNAVRENRSRFRAICELPSEPRWLRQVHGTNVEIEPPSGETPQADAAITRHPGVVCVVLTADCLPVLLASADGAELAVAHAGWRGLAGGVLEATVREMSAPRRPDRLAGPGHFAAGIRGRARGKAGISRTRPGRGKVLRSQ